MIPEQDEWAQSESTIGHTNLVVTRIRRSVGIQGAQDIWGKRRLFQIDLTEKNKSYIGYYTTVVAVHTFDLIKNSV